MTKIAAQARNDEGEKAGRRGHRPLRFAHRTDIFAARGHSPTEVHHACKASTAIRGTTLWCYV